MVELECAIAEGASPDVHALAVFLLLREEPGVRHEAVRRDDAGAPVLGPLNGLADDARHGAGVAIDEAVVSVELAAKSFSKVNISTCSHPCTARGAVGRAARACPREQRAQAPGAVSPGPGIAKFLW